jgi:uncharacterized protein YjbI with pentapeptide repeats
MITQDFQLILAGHKRWLSDHPGRSRANSSLQELAAIDFGGANLEQAKLTGAHLAASMLSGINFHLADMFAADLRNSNLIGADLSGWSSPIGAQHQARH